MLNCLSRVYMNRIYLMSSAVYLVGRIRLKYIHSGPDTQIRVTDLALPCAQIFTDLF